MTLGNKVFVSGTKVHYFLELNKFPQKFLNRKIKKRTFAQQKRSKIP